MNGQEAMFARTVIEVLVVEDDLDYVDFLRRTLANDRAIEFRISTAASLQAGIASFQEDRPQAALLDLGLPDSHGLRTVRHFLERAGETALLVLTALEDQHVAQQALSLGAQEYLVKDAVTSDLLSRAIRYAVDRQHLLNQLRSAREAETRERELRRVERMALEPTLRATASMYGNDALVDRSPEQAAALETEYGRLLDLALEARAFDSGWGHRHDLRSMAGVLGYLGAKPRDVVALHAHALRDRMGDASYERGQAYLEEGRIMALELMGYLAAWYRMHALGQGQRPASSSGSAVGNGASS